MNIKTVKLGFSNIKNKIFERLYIKSNIDFTKPVQIYGMINKRCNACCIMCNSWRSEKFEELPAKDWIEGLRSLKSFVGSFHINFSGGEPFLKKDFFDILDFCRKEKISSGITTNGLLLKDLNLERILGLDLLNINISLDSMDPLIHDKLRGVPGMLEKVKENINILVKRKHALNKDVKIVLKPIVCNMNLSGLDDIVRYAAQMSLTGVNFQPIFRWSKESASMFRVNMQDLEVAIEKLIKLKKEGYPILNSENAIKRWIHYFKGEINSRDSICHVAVRNLNINPDGEMTLCGFCDSSIGNFKNENIKSAWYSQSTKDLRKSLVHCKRLCTATCVVKRNWSDYAQLFLSLTKK